jgi:hypothetical protein
MDLSTTEIGTRFRAADIKLKRARRHFSELEAVSQAYFATEPVRIETTEAFPKIHFSFDVKQGPPDAISAIVGDILHNLRAALDLMACELCHDERAAFPFSNSKETLRETLRSTRFNKAGDAAIRLIVELKPYPKGNIKLRAIHDLDIQDKHRALILGPISFASPIIDTVAKKVIGDLSKPSDLTLMFGGDSPFGEAPLLKTLHELVELTTGIIESFKRLSVPSGESPIVGDSG